MINLDNELLYKLEIIASNFYFFSNDEFVEILAEIANLDKHLFGSNPLKAIEIIKSNFDNIIISQRINNKIQSLFLKYQTLISNDKINSSPKIAYFTPEIAIHESLPMYAGGLGILAGDHMKAAADLGYNITCVSLYYNKGYIQQKIIKYEQVSNDEDILLEDYPIETLRDKEGKKIRLFVNFPDGKCFFEIKKLLIGNNIVLLLDTDINKNKNKFKHITNKLYGGDRELRLRQEIILGIGGYKALRELNLEPDFLHINEGHAAFSLLERARQFSEDQELSFKEAYKILRTKNLFTTHTPVIHGNEEFDDKLIEYFFEHYSVDLLLTKHEFLGLGKSSPTNNDEKFSMSILSFKLSQYSNGVSNLHGTTAKKMWEHIFPRLEKDQDEIRFVTNGIHISSWIAPSISEIFNDCIDFSVLSELSDYEILDIRLKNKRRLLERINKKTNFKISESAFIIGFARRFAPYKRADLLFTNMPRLRKILKNPNKPVILVISGKAHPQDTDGLAIISSILKKIDRFNLQSHVIFLENYDMEIGRLMTQGCDLWLNTPEKPKEACGTSGMKAMLNGCVNFSKLDGWWYEAYNGRNGYKITDFDDVTVELEDIYSQLENTIIDKYYSINNNSNNWINMIREGWDTISYFDAERMLSEYYEMYYTK